MSKKPWFCSHAGLSNGLLQQWPKVEKGKMALEQIMAESDLQGEGGPRAICQMVGYVEECIMPQQSSYHSKEPPSSPPVPFNANC